MIRFAKTLPITPISRSLVDQLVRAATSIGANYCEANEAESKKDFRHKISLCRKEARETRHWLRMIAVAVEDAAPQARTLWQEAKQLTLIFAKIVRSCDGRA